MAKRSKDLTCFLQGHKSIIVTTQQKFSWILKQIEDDPALKNQRVAFLIDEAHRSQEGRMGAAIRLPFRKPDEPDAEPEEADAEEEIARIILAHDHNQLFVAFTATPSQTTVDLFGDTFDTYSEAEAIAEGYIVDVASSIISFKTLYNLHCSYIPKPDEKARLYPAGVVVQALRNVAYQDEELIQYKAEVMLRIFEESVKPLIGGRAKGMIVASSRVAGLRYFEILKEKLRERGADYKDAEEFRLCLSLGKDAPIQAAVQALRERFQTALAEGEPRRGYVRLLARYVKSLHFLECFFTYPQTLKDFAEFADYVGPQLIKLGSISELMKRVQATEVVGRRLKTLARFQARALEAAGKGDPYRLAAGEARPLRWWTFRT